MKLGSETASLMNHIYSRTRGLDPVVGMGGTVLCWTDREAVTVIDVQQDGNLVVVQEDDARRTDTNGMSEDQHYAYTPNAAGRVYYFRRKDKDHAWCQVVLTGHSKHGKPRYRNNQGEGLVLGDRRKYHDFSF